MNDSEIIDLGISNISNSPTLGPKLSVTSKDDRGTIKLNNLPSLDSISTTPSRSVNFGPGADLLMNAGRASRQNSPKSDIQLSELRGLDQISEPKVSTREIRAKAFAMGPIEPTIKLNISEPINTPPMPLNSSGLGNSTAQEVKKEETWDGFQKFNEIPVDPVKQIPETPMLTPEQTLKEKFVYIRKLEALDKKGVQISKKYSMDDSLDEMKGEYEMIKSEQQKKNSCKFQGKMLMAFVSGIEFLNGKFDPFDIKLDGWGEAVS